MFTVTLGLKKSDGQLALLDNGSSNDQRAQIEALDNYSAETYNELYVVDSVLGVVERRELNIPDIKGKRLVITAKSFLSQVYGDAAPTNAVTITGFEDGDTVSNLTGSISYTVKDSSGNTVSVSASTAPGTYRIIPSGYSSNKYFVEYREGVLKIAKKTLTVTAADKSIKEFGSAPEYTATITGFVTGESASNLTGSLSYAVKTAAGAAVDSVASAAPGVYQIVPSGYTSNNYDIVFVAGKLTITELPDLTITAKDKTMTAGGSAPEYEVTATGFVDDDDISDLTGSLTYTIKDGDDTVSDVTVAEAGTYQIIPSGLSSSDYDIHFVAGTLTIESE